MTKKKAASADRQVVVGDKTYTVRFSIRAMMALQDHYDLPSLDQVGTKLQDSSSLSVQDMVAIMYAGLRTHHPDTSMEDALGILDELGMSGVQQALGGAIDSAMPAATDSGDSSDDPR